MISPDHDEARTIEAREAHEAWWMRPDGPFVQRGGGPRRQRVAGGGAAAGNASRPPGTTSALLSSADYQRWMDAIDDGDRRHGR